VTTLSRASSDDAARVTKPRSRRPATILPAPWRVIHVTFVKVSSGGFATYAIDSAGQLWAWGGDQSGQLGTGSQQRIETLPVDVGIHLEQVSSTAQDVAGLGHRS
jgi:alpha-tubulin suppressor-like RCC1 family protein